MELPHIGTQCSVPDCKQLDFLPFTCPACGMCLCDRHHDASAHGCSGPAAAARAAPPPTRTFPCMYAGCSDASPVEMRCAACARHHCVKHRHHGCLDRMHSDSEKRRWQEPKISFAAAKAQVDRQVEAALQSARQKSNTTALKVRLMRLKSKAVGPKTVPHEDRAYFFANPPASTGLPGKAAYVSARWSLGRAVDALADALGVPNANNKPGSTKLALLRDGAEVSDDASQTLASLIKNGKIVEGDTVSLEFISM